MIFGKKRSHGISALQKTPAANSTATYEGLPLTVVYTTAEATLAALRYAGELAAQLGARIRVLMIQAVPYALPLDRPQVDPNFRIRQFLTRSENEWVDTRIDALLCRDVQACLLEALKPRSLVLIGAHRRRWFAREKRWERTLKRAGHHVIIVEGDGKESESFRNRLNRARRISFQTVIDKDVSRFMPFLGARQQTPQSAPNLLIRLLHRLIR